MSTAAIPTPAYPPLKDPLQPPGPSYDSSKLERAIEYTAQSYETEFGVAPPYNPALPVKTWADPAAASLPPWSYLQYQSIQQINGIWQMAPLSLPAQIAAQVNIPPGWPVAASPAPVTPVPMRALLPNEQLSKVYGVFGWNIIRTDMQQTGVDQAPPASGTDNATLARILVGLETIAKQMGITFLILLIFAVASIAQTGPTCALAGPAKLNVGASLTLNVACTGLTAAGNITGIQFTYAPPANLNWSSFTQAIGAAGTAANKTLTCGPTTSWSSTNPGICIVIGQNQTAMADGTIASFTFAPTTAGSWNFALSNPIATSGAGANVAITAGAALAVAVANPCDINGDGKVDINDVTMYVNSDVIPYWLASFLNMPLPTIIDLTGDGKPDVKDVQRIANAASGACVTGP